MSTTTRRPHPPADTTFRASHIPQAKHTDLPNLLPAALPQHAAAGTVYRATLRDGMFGMLMDQATSMGAILAAGAGTMTEAAVPKERAVAQCGAVQCRTVAMEKGGEGRKIRARGKL